MEQSLWLLINENEQTDETWEEAIRLTMASNISSTLSIALHYRFSTLECQSIYVNLVDRHFAESKPLINY